MPANKPDQEPADPCPAEVWRWLSSESGRLAIEAVSGRGENPIQWINWLRKQGHSAERVRAVVDQVTLRPVAAKKFSQAGQMFFTRQLLEQSTDERIAAYKAGRFRATSHIVDYCCGLGGDLMAMAGNRAAAGNGAVAAEGVDSSVVACELARANCRAVGIDVEIVNAFAENYVAKPGSWFHVDPDRRATGKRSTHVGQFSPGPEFLQQLIANHENGAIKLAPVTDVPEDWPPAERQWIGDRSECKQQVLWIGQAAQASGCRSAAAVDSEGSIMFEWVEREIVPCKLARQIAEFIYEPHPTIIAGRMVDSFAAESGLRKLARDVQYLTGPCVERVGMKGFEVIETTRLDKRSIVDCLKRNDCGPLEVKKRGVDHELLDIWTQTRFDGTESLVLILTRLGDQYLAIICRRLE